MSGFMFMRFERDTRYYELALEPMGSMWVVARRWGSMARRMHRSAEELYGSHEDALKRLDYQVKRRKQHKYEAVE